MERLADAMKNAAATKIRQVLIIIAGERVWEGRNN
jgi:hypothetical protein